MTSPLTGRRILVTRERPGELSRLLKARGATVVHVPLVGVMEPDDAGAQLRRELQRLDQYDWLMVTSAAGAERVASAAASVPSVRLGAVGTATARSLERGIGRSVDLVPATQRASALVEAFTAEHPTPQRVLLALADRASGVLADGLRAAGHAVTSVVAYRTVALRPDPTAIADADAVLFASGSAVASWYDTFGTSCPAIVVAIGPTTAAIADGLGLKVSGVATDHSLDGLVTELEHQVANSVIRGR